MKKLCLFLFFLCVTGSTIAQIINIKLFDNETREPLHGATIKVGAQTFFSKADGSVSIPAEHLEIEISFSGYENLTVRLDQTTTAIGIQRKANNLQEVVVSANREAIKRTQAPIAIATISARTINETKATTIDQLVNKVSGAYMVNLGNEQHAMGIRQPMGTRSLFLYLEDGIPIRTSGVFNHNALMEMNMAAVKNIEVVKGPSSSLYGGEAIGGAVNMITQAPTAIPTLRASLQYNNIGYRRADLQTGFTKGRWGFALSGYYTQRKSGFIEFSDFHKAIGTARIDYRFSNKVRLENSLTYMDYYSDMSGGIDSVMFANQSFKSQQTFTYRKATTLRHRSSLFWEWNENSKTTVHAVYRDNKMGMNPSFRVRDDYRRQGGGFVGKKEVAHGEISDNSFKSYVAILQHRQQFKWLQTSLIGGGTVDISPNTAIANYIRIKKDTINNKYVSYENRADSLLVKYNTGITNIAAFLNYECTPVKNLRIVASLRYDAFRYNFNNYLPVSSVSGSPDTISNFSKFSPKLGFTYNFKNNSGIYFNYSAGFVPPQVSELYRAVKIPVLEPSTFISTEIGGWAELIKDKLTADISLYQMEGKNSIISVRFDDGTFGNANAGATLHKGIELGLNATPIKDLQIRFSGAYSKHTFKTYIERGVKFNGNEINNAPNWVHNAEVTYRPSFIKGFRLAVEWQKMSKYFMDQANLFQYNGFDVVNARLGYRLKGAEVWLNIINVLDAYYAVNSSKSQFGYNYTPGEPRNFNLGISYDFGTLLKKTTK